MFRITLRQLEIFRAVAGEGSTAAAALKLPLSQSATSAGLNQLERSLGFRLFDRIGKRLAINAEGKALLSKALGVLDNAHQLETGDSRSGAFDLRIHASTTIGNYLVPRLLASFRRECPQGRVETRIGNTLEVTRAVQDFSSELGLIEGPCHEPGLVVTPWIRDELVLVAAPAHPLARAAKRRPLTIAQLSAAPWLLREEGSGTREAVDLALLPHIHSFGEARVLGGSEAIKNTAAYGLGVSCLSRWVVEDLVRARRLSILATRLPPLERRLSLVWHREKTLSGGLSRFIAHCRSLEPGPLPRPQRR